MSSSPTPANLMTQPFQEKSIVSLQDDMGGGIKTEHLMHLFVSNHVFMMQMS